MFAVEPMTYICMCNQLILYTFQCACINECEYNEKN